MRQEMRAPSNLDDLGLRHIYDLYGALAQVMSPTQANECELWELAAVLGVDPGTVEVSGVDDRLAAEATPVQLRARVAKAKIKPRRSSKDPANADIPPPPPKTGEPTVITDLVMRQMGI